MSLFAKLREQRLAQFATDTTATFATHETVPAQNESFHVPSVAAVATVAVAKQPERKVPPQAVNDELELELQMLEAAMRACDYWGDSDQARAEMIADIKATPQHLRQDLLEHLLVAYGKAK